MLFKQHRIHCPLLGQSGFGGTPAVSDTNSGKPQEVGIAPIVSWLCSEGFSIYKKS